jgi:sulfur-carrier protein adenylyltransferase/sulfurtransferase
MALTASELDRYARHLALAEVGPEGQDRLRASRVAVIGAGGLGSPAALYLAAAGIGTIGLIDGDRVELSNLQRQILFAVADLDRPKAVAARERLLALNPEISVEAYAVALAAGNAEELVRGFDIIVDGTDRLRTRYLVNDACVLLGKPLVTAAIHRFEGQAMSYVPGRGPCYRCLFPDSAGAAVANCAEAGVLGVLPGVMGAIQASEAIKLILGLGEALVGRLLLFDALEMRFESFPVARRPDCAVCGDRPSITSLKPEPSFERWSPQELRTRLEPGAGRRLALIDVREPAEFALGHLPGAVSLPLGELERRSTEIAADVLPVFICKSGRRSEQACRMVAERGLAPLAHLEGGLLAWVAAIDPSLPLA